MWLGREERTNPIVITVPQQVEAPWELASPSDLGIAGRRQKDNLWFPGIIAAFQAARV